MLISALAALVLFAAPETVQSGDTSPVARPAAEAKEPKRTCYKAKPSGSRLERKVCVTSAPKGEEKAEDEGKSAGPKPE